MTKKLNITKDYKFDKSYNDLFSDLDTIISTPFNNSKFSTFGNFISAEPPEFVFMNKWISFGRPMFAEAASTKIFATLYDDNNKSKITIRTKTNPAVIIFFVALSIIFVIKLLTYKTSADIKMLSIYFGLMLSTIFFDRFIKNILIAAFEDDLKIRSN